MTEYSFHNVRSLRLPGCNPLIWEGDHQDSTLKVEIPTPRGHREDSNHLTKP